MVTLSFTIFSGQKNYNRAHMLFQVLCGFEPIFYTTHPNEESNLFPCIEFKIGQNALIEEKNASKRNFIVGTVVIGTVLGIVVNYISNFIF